MQEEVLSQMTVLSLAGYETVSIALTVRPISTKIPMNYATYSSLVGTHRPLSLPGEAAKTSRRTSLAIPLLGPNMGPTDVLHTLSRCSCPRSPPTSPTTSTDYSCGETTLLGLECCQDTEASCKATEDDILPLSTPILQRLHRERYQDTRPNTFDESGRMALGPQRSRIPA